MIRLCVQREMVVGDTFLREKKYIYMCTSCTWVGQEGGRVIDRAIDSTIQTWRGNSQRHMAPD